MLLTCVSLTAAAYSETLDQRRGAAWGPPPPVGPNPYQFNCDAVWETDFAAGNERIIAVFNVGHEMANAVGFAIGEPDDPNDWSDPNCWTWTEGQIPWYDPNDPNAIQFDRAIDPSVAYHPNTGDFLAGGLLRTVSSEVHIGVARFNGSEGFDPWESVQKVDPNDPSEPNFPHTFDKPWLVSGGRESSQREYYVVWCNQYWDPNEPNPPFAGSYSYRRSSDGSATWHGGEIKVNGERVTGGFCAQPAVHENGPLYIAYKHDGTTIRFLEGTDDPNGPGVSFDYLYAVDQPIGRSWTPEPSRLQVSLRAARVRDQLPGAVYTALTIPQLATDPGDPNCLYVTYHDVKNSDPNNVDVILRRLTKAGNGWSSSSAYRVARDGPNSHADQFCPALIVDGQGRVHVTYYDDRDDRDGGAQDEDQDDETENPKFDLYYTVVTFDEYGDPSFSVYEIEGADPNEPALDFTRALYWGNYRPGEYNGIGWLLNTGDNTEVWMSFAGTSVDDGSNDQSVIHYSRTTFAD